ncbi:MAG: hypothetical protein K2N74_06250, partial [Clostridiales bacterium]|nr:hypothetical protein [Clostridiales bacterium]
YQCSVCKQYFDEAHKEIDDITTPINPTEHSFGETATTGANGEKVFTCEYNHAHTKSVALSKIEITSAPEYLIKNGESIDLSEFALRAVYEDGSNENITNNSALTNNASQVSAHTLAALTFSYYGKPATRSLPVYEKVKTADTKTYTPYTLDNVVYTTNSGEFVYKFTINVTAAGADVWDSWVLGFDTGSTSAVLRADSWILGNFGRGDGDAGSNEFTWTGKDFKTGEIQFMVAREYVTNHYRLTVTLAQGEDTSIAVIDEPASNPATMTLKFGGDHCTYSYSDVIVYAAARERSGLRVNPESVEVKLGTSLDDIKSKISVYQTFTIGNDAAIDAATCTLSCSSYDAQAAGNYLVTVSDGDFSATLTVTVLAAAESTIQRLAYFTPQTVNNQGNFVSGSTQAGAGNILNGYWTPYTKPVSMANPFKGQNTSGVVIHADVKINSANTWAPLFSIRAAEGANQAFLSIATNDTNKWRISYNAWQDNIYGDEVIQTVASGALCLTVRIDETGVSVFVGGVSVLSLTESK